MIGYRQELPWPAQVGIILATLLMVGSSVLHGKHSWIIDEETNEHYHITARADDPDEQEFELHIVFLAASIVLGVVATGGAAFGRRLGQRLLADPEERVVDGTALRAAPSAAPTGLPRGIEVEASTVHTGLGRVGVEGEMLVGVEVDDLQTGVGGQELLVANDTGWSEWPFVAFAQALHDGASKAVFDHQWPPLRAWASMGLRNAIQQQYSDLDGIDDIVCGPTTIQRVEVTRQWTKVQVRLRNLRLERARGRETWIDATEVWTFRRATDATSPPPQEMASLGCAFCGTAPAMVDADYHCEACGTVLDASTSWVAIDGVVVTHAPLAAPPPVPTHGGRLPSFDVDIGADAHLGAELRGLQARHPGTGAFDNRVAAIHAALCHAHTAQDEAGLGAFVLPHIASEVHWDMLRHAASHRVRREEDPSVVRVALLSVQPDAWHENVVLQVWLSARRSVHDAGSGELVGGNATEPGQWSEVWTLSHRSGQPVHDGGWRLARIEELT